MEVSLLGSFRDQIKLSDEYGIRLILEVMLEVVQDNWIWSIFLRDDIRLGPID